MKTNGPCISAEIQAQIEPPLIPLIKAELEEQKATNIIKANIWRNPLQAASVTYTFNMYIFNDVQLE